MPKRQKCPMIPGLQRAQQFLAQLEAVRTNTPQALTAEAGILRQAIELIQAWHDNSVLPQNTSWKYSRNNECGDGSRTIDLTGYPMHFAMLTHLYGPASQVTLDGEVVRLTCTCGVK